MLPGIGPARLRQLLTVFDTPAQILNAAQSAIASVSGIGPKLANIIVDHPAHCDLEKELALAERAGVHILTEEDECYPPLLKEIHDPPVCLYVRGNPEILKRTRRAIAIVGSRQTTFYGQRVAATMAQSAARDGWTVVSGLARGIDTTAHKACVDADGPTIAVLGSGLGRIYPQENVELARRIAAGNGAVISEFPMNFPPDRRSFPMRNRIISGICKGCIVVEAGLKSGSLITANQALEQNRQVFAVPGHIDQHQAQGCNRLIQDGAKLIQSFHDVVEEFSINPVLPMFNEILGKTEQKNNSSKRPDLQLSELEDKIMVFLEQGETDTDNMVTSMQEPVSKILSTLISLELKGLVRQLPGKRVTAVKGTVF